MVLKYRVRLCEHCVYPPPGVQVLVMQGANMYDAYRRPPFGFPLFLDCSEAWSLDRHGYPDTPCQCLPNRVSAVAATVVGLALA
jgi:hypothetical protein